MNLAKVTLNVIIARMIQRELQGKILDLLGQEAAVGILGPRQVGKTTLALALKTARKSIYLDLESPIDRKKLEDPYAFLEMYPNSSIILDEIQRVPDLFPILRGVIDREKRNNSDTGRFLILGSASLDLLKQSSESLAGRIAFVELKPINSLELKKEKRELEKLWLRGGFPRSYLADSEEKSLQWRQSFISTYLERDIPQLGPKIPSETLRRFWTMLAHLQGSSLNAAQIAGSLEVSGMTVGRYLDLMVDLFLVRRLSPWYSNAGKRLIKSPKVYVRDSGLVHALLNIKDFSALLSHPVNGFSYEGFIIENIIASLPFGADFGFYRTSAGAEIDLVIKMPSTELIAVDVKRNKTPKVEKGFHIACDDLKCDKRFVVYPGNEKFPLASGVVAIGLSDLLNTLK